MVFDDKGFVLTPYHVVDGATKVYVHVAGGGSYADDLAADARTDLAVLRLLNPPPGLRALKFGEVRLGPDRPTVDRGKLVVEVAHAYTANLPLDRPAAALGSLTNVHRSVPIPPSPTHPKPNSVPKSDSYYFHGPLLEHDARFRPGLSGAALLNLDGELIGLTTTAPPLGLGDRTPGYAFPLDARLRRIVDVLRRGEEVEYGYLGVYTPPDAAGPVVQLSDVVPLGPADQAGVQRNDVITAIDGVPIRRYEDLLAQVGSALAGTKVALTVQRNRGQPVQLTATLGKLRHDQPWVASARPDPVFGLRVDYGSILAQQEGRKNPQLLAEGVPAGVSVADVATGSPAAAALKKLGDPPQRWLVTHANGTAVASPREFYAAAKGQPSVKLTLIDPTEPRAKRQTREVTLP